MNRPWMSLSAYLFAIVIASTPLEASQTTWSRSSLAQIVSEILGNGQAEFITFEDLLEKEIDPEDHVSFQRKKKDELKDMLPDDDIWFYSHDGLALSIWIAGQEDSIHTISLKLIPINVNETGEARLRVILPTLFAAFLPTWDKAPDWPWQSFEKSWNAYITNQANQSRQAFMDQAVIQDRHGNVQLSTAGVPPDLVVFRITTLPQCDLLVHGERMFQRWVC